MKLDIRSNNPTSINNIKKSHKIEMDTFFCRSLTNFVSKVA